MMDTQCYTGADFSKFQVVFRFALRILPADELKGFKVQQAPGTKNTSNKCSGTTM
jgi:hypothetical protein